MARTLAALKVKITRAADGRAKYPDFGTLASVQATGLDWAKYVDIHGTGWLYDKVSGHDDDDADSPVGQQWGVLLVPETFVTEALAAFPVECTRLTEAACQTFHDTRARVQEDAEVRDAIILDGLRAEFELIKEALADPALPAGGKTKLETRRAALWQRLRTALDPDDPAPGVRKNFRKKWVDFKAKAAITFSEPT